MLVIVLQCIYVYLSMKSESESESESRSIFTDVACGGYSTLSDNDRRVSFVDGSAICDSSLATRWYRFSGSAGTQMLTYCPSDRGSVYRCRTHGMGWLNGAHPSTAEGEVTRTVCFAWSSTCCDWSSSIKVRNCGSYFVYYFGAPPACSLRWCGNA